MPTARLPTTNMYALHSLTYGDAPSTEVTEVRRGSRRMPGDRRSYERCLASLSRVLASRWEFGNVVRVLVAAAGGYIGALLAPFFWTAGA
jgi:hypothetical protein